MARLSGPFAPLRNVEFDAAGALPSSFEHLPSVS
jgi:hypothetical protein